MVLRAASLLLQFLAKAVQDRSRSRDVAKDFTKKGKSVHGLLQASFDLEHCFSDREESV
jgi:hypothetical protein